jgi:hypothetical protein
MSLKDTEKLIAQVKNETAKNANTANRVGAAMEGLIPGTTFVRWTEVNDGRFVYTHDFNDCKDKTILIRTAYNSPDLLDLRELVLKGSDAGKKGGRLLLCIDNMDWNNGRDFLLKFARYKNPNNSPSTPEMLLHGTNWFGTCACYCTGCSCCYTNYSPPNYVGYGSRQNLYYDSRESNAVYIQNIDKYRAMWFVELVEMPGLGVLPTENSMNLVYVRLWWSDMMDIQPLY